MIPHARYQLEMLRIHGNHVAFRQRIEGQTSPPFVKNLAETDTPHLYSTFILEVTKDKNIIRHVNY